MGSMSLPSSLFLLLKHMWELQGPFINDVSKEVKGLRDEPNSDQRKGGYVNWY